jgi:hypothetical protein
MGSSLAVTAAAANTLRWAGNSEHKISCDPDNLKIVLATIGSRGDEQPFVNLCQGLQEAGHDVILATNPMLCSLTVSHGL